MTKVYNQNKAGIGPDCTIFSCNQIMANKFGIDFKYTFIDSVVMLAIRAGVLFRKGGARFEPLYNWYCYKINKDFTKIAQKVTGDKNTVINFRVKKINLLTDKISGPYGIWLKNGNQQYIDSINRGNITPFEINDIKFEGGGFQHNTVFDNSSIYEIYLGKKADCTLYTLKHGIKKDLFGSVGRTFEPNNDFTRDVCKLLIKTKNNRHYDPYYKNITNYQTNVMNVANQILFEYEIR